MLCSKWKYLVTENNGREGGVCWGLKAKLRCASVSLSVCVCVRARVCIYITWRTNSEKALEIFKCKANEKRYDSSACRFFLTSYNKLLTSAWPIWCCVLQCIVAFSWAFGQPVGVNTILVSQAVREFIWAFCIQVVWSHTTGDELGSADTNSPRRIFLPEVCSAWEKEKQQRICLSCWHHCRAEHSSSWIILFTPKCTEKYCLAVAEMSGKKRLFYKCLYIFSNIFCTYVFIYYAFITE